MSVEISGQTVKAVVGEQIDIAPKFKEGRGTVHSVKYEIPEYAVKGYVDKGQSKAERTLLTPEDKVVDKAPFNLQFYWVNKGKRKVKAQVTYKPQGGSPVPDDPQECDFDVSGPTVDPFQCIIGPLELDDVSYPPFVSFGLPNLPGVLWHWTITVPEEGEVKDVQTIEARDTRVTSSGVTQVHRGKYPPGSVQLDTSNPYSKGSKIKKKSQRLPQLVRATHTADGNAGINDSPYQELTDDTGFAFASEVTIHDDFKYYIMYKPKKADVPTIWVPVYMAEWFWNWKVVANNTGGFDKQLWTTSTSVHGKDIMQYPEEIRFPRYKSNWKTNDWV